MKRKIIIALAIALAVVVATVAATYTASLDEYAVVYTMPGDGTIQLQRQATSLRAARRAAKRNTPPGGELLTVFIWQPPYPLPSAWAGESGASNG